MRGDLVERDAQKKQLVLFTHKGYGVAIILLTGYAAFAIAGNQLFMLQSRMVFSTSKLVSLLLVAVMIYPIELACLGLLVLSERKCQLEMVRRLFTRAAFA